MAQRPLLITASTALSALMLTGCVANQPAGGEGSIKVSSTENECKVATAEVQSGTLTFDVKNDGTRVTEFYLLADDGLRIVGEVENIAPGASRTLTVVAQPGNYFTSCKPGMIGEGVGKTDFKVTGDRVEISGEQAEAEKTAVENYRAYVRDQVSQLQPLTDEFVDAYVSGDDEKARELFAKVRLPYERIEPTAEAFGDLDPKIDYREVDARAEGLDWTGFHRIEKDLWQPKAGDKNSDDTDALQGWKQSTPDERKKLGEALKQDVAQLAELVKSDDFQVSLGDITNGAIGLLDEVATGKVTGEEDWWSKTDLMDFKGNVEGAEVAYGIVRDIALSKGDEAKALVEDIDAGFADLNSELAQYGSIEQGFKPYNDLTAEQIKALSDKVSALAEPLSQLTNTVLSQ